jgi:hypothetical protein
MPSSGKSCTLTSSGWSRRRHVRPAFLKAPMSSFFFVLSKYFDNTNYDPARIMDRLSVTSRAA